MYLKSVSMKGFKSFPDRTRLEFGEGVSVVVGPNGSGKSNITDAVLWALGEQSPLAVRGQSMQDVIFAGGRGVQARKEAEVELVLDNSDATIDVPASELSIVRRLNRAGEGEYRMNGARCRLVDVLEVLSDTGIGKEAHSVVSQGRIEAIVTSKPRDRRLLIEEAAGLGKHRKRRRRAQLKLERTADNLERSLDIEREARARLRPLKRQAEAAALHERLELQSGQARWELLRDEVRLRLERRASAESAGGRSAGAADGARGRARPGGEAPRVSRAGALGAKRAAGRDRAPGVRGAKRAGQGRDALRAGAAARRRFGGAVGPPVGRARGTRVCGGRAAGVGGWADRRARGRPGGPRPGARGDGGARGRRARCRPRGGSGEARRAGRRSLQHAARRAPRRRRRSSRRGPPGGGGAGGRGRPAGGGGRGGGAGGGQPVPAQPRRGVRPAERVGARAGGGGRATSWRWPRRSAVGWRRPSWPIGRPAARCSTGPGRTVDGCSWGAAECHGSGRGASGVPADRRGRRRCRVRRRPGHGGWPSWSAGRPDAVGVVGRLLADAWVVERWTGLPTTSGGSP